MYNTATAPVLTALWDQREALRFRRGANSADPWDFGDSPADLDLNGFAATRASLERYFTKKALDEAVFTCRNPFWLMFVLYNAAVGLKGFHRKAGAARLRSSIEDARYFELLPALDAVLEKTTAPEELRDMIPNLQERQIKALLERGVLLGNWREPNELEVNPILLYERPTNGAGAAAAALHRGWGEVETLADAVDREGLVLVIGLGVEALYRDGERICTAERLTPQQILDASLSDFTTIELKASVAVQPASMPLLLKDVLALAA